MKCVHPCNTTFHIDDKSQVRISMGKKYTKKISRKKNLKPGNKNDNFVCSDSKKESRERFVGTIKYSSNKIEDWLPFLQPILCHILQYRFLQEDQLNFEKYSQILLQKVELHCSIKSKILESI